MELSLVGVQPVNASFHSVIHLSTMIWCVSCRLLPLFSYMHDVCVCIFIFMQQFICFTVEILTFLCIKSSIWMSEKNFLLWLCCALLIWSSALTDLSFITTWPFLWKVSAVTLVSCLPLYIIKYLKRKFSPPSYSKLSSWSKYRFLKFVLCFFECPIYSTLF